MPESPGEARRAGVVGDPVEHSLSPEIFKILSTKSGVRVDYKKIPVSSREFKRTLARAADSGAFDGWNITIPHKETAARQVDQVDPSARTLGAVNVVQFQNGKLIGYNTDVFGITETLRRRGFDCRGKTAVVFGAGGGAAALVFALSSERSSRIVVVNRTRSKASALCTRLQKEFPKTRIFTATKAPSDADLYINATPLGMKGFPPSPELPRFEKKKVLVFDLVYRPARTEFLQSGRKQGAQIANGLEMLVAQAIASWEIWFGRLPKKLDRGELQSTICKSLRAKLRRREKA